MLLLKKENSSFVENTEIHAMTSSHIQISIKKKINILKLFQDHINCIMIQAQFFFVCKSINFVQSNSVYLSKRR
jgi:hypothetical protein